MSLLVVGTVPVQPGRVFAGPVEPLGGGMLSVGGEPLPACQGTAVMLLAALAAAQATGAPTPYALLGGDIGRGDGTKAAYAALPGLAEKTGATVIAFHYLQPVMALMKRAVEQLGAPSRRLVADAGGMYAARAAGLARHFELMTPDVGEIGFLADDEAIHPAYVAHYLFGQASFDPAGYARLAWQRGGSSRVVLVKGKTDLVCVEGEVMATVSEPNVPELEAIGGTGDTITGLCAGLMSGGMSAEDAALVAARCNRLAGKRIGARPAHRASDIVEAFPEVLADLIG